MLAIKAPRLFDPATHRKENNNLFKLGSLLPTVPGSRLRLDEAGRDDLLHPGAALHSVTDDPGHFPGTPGVSR